MVTPERSRADWTGGRSPAQQVPSSGFLVPAPRDPAVGVLPVPLCGVTGEEGRRSGGPVAQPAHTKSAPSSLALEAAVQGWQRPCPRPIRASGPRAPRTAAPAPRCSRPQPGRPSPGRSGPPASCTQPARVPAATWGDEKCAGPGEPRLSGLKRPFDSVT